MDYINQIILGHALNVLPKLPAESVNCVVTSPPYFSLRNYGIEPVIWDGDEDCKHDFNEYDSKLLHENRQNLDGGTLGNPKYRKNLHGFGSAKAGFCSKCGAWRGSLGLEPTFELYIKHLCDIFGEVKRVLRKDGVCFVNLGDSYAGSGKAGSSPEYQSKHTEFGKPSIHPERFGMPTTKINYPNKSLCLIPQRFVIEMVNRGWIAHNVIIWHKPNCMPESAKHRFTRDFEYLYFFSKSNKTLFWTNEKTLECVDKQPLGTKGIEGEDWEWRKDSKDKLKKVSLWSGHDYWFEQQFEEYAPDTLPRMDRGVNINKWTLGADGQTPHNLSQPRKRKERGYKTKQMDKEIHRQQHHGKDINYGKYGRNKRCVWKIPTKSFKAAHFATFPETLIEPIIKAGCPEFVCEKCGMARVKILEPTEEYKKLLGKGWHPHKHDAERGMSETPDKRVSCTAEYKSKGYTDCGCNAGFEPGIVLDPFIGAGTTAKVAIKQRKRFTGIDIKKEYIEMSKRGITKVQRNLF